MTQTIRLEWNGLECLVTNVFSENETVRLAVVEPQKHFKVFLGFCKCQKRLPRTCFSRKSGATCQRTFNICDLQIYTCKLHTSLNIKVFESQVT